MTERFRRRARLTPLALVLVVSAGTAHATPAADLDRGRSSFRARDYESAIPVLNALLYPRPVLSQTADLVETHLLLGGSLYEANDRERAREEFERALQLEPERSISTLQYSEGAVKMFEVTLRSSMGETASPSALRLIPMGSSSKKI